MDEIMLGSLFDGIGGFPYAASFYGIRPLWASEIVPECISVAKRHFPEMIHTGDITLLHGKKLPPVDIITFGSPCQGLSVAGHRRGFADKRSALFTEAIRIIDEMKEATHGKYPKLALWENVPGALSSAGGRDYQAVLEAFTKTKIPMPCSGRWANAGMVRSRGIDLAWCVYNAQYFGTAQRRRRVFLVADFRGKSAGKVLFIPKKLCRYFASCGTPRQGTTAFTESDSEGTGGETDKFLLDKRIADNHVYCIAGNTIGRQSHNGGNGMGCQKEIAYTLTAMDRHAVTAPSALYSQPYDHLAMKTERLAYISSAGTGINNSLSGALRPDVQMRYVVRRLTPLECERLQGFPDGWTEQGHDGQKISDSRRYQMLGNSIAIPCAAYIMEGVYQILADI